MKMKTNFNQFILAFFMVSIALLGCESETINPSTSDGNLDYKEEKASSTTGRIMAPVPECDLISVDWDGIVMGVNQTRTFEVKLVPGAIYKWTVSGPIKIVGSDDLNRVTVQITGSLGSAFLSVTMDVPGNANLACGNTGRIKILHVPPCSPPTPEFQVMDSNWNSSGDTCADQLLELGVVSDEICSDFIRYEWVIHGATIQNVTADGRYIFVRTGSVGTILYFKVRGVYSSGTTNWSSLSGQVVSGICLN